MSSYELEEYKNETEILYFSLDSLVAKAFSVVANMGLEEKSPKMARVYTKAIGMEGAFTDALLAFFKGIYNTIAYIANAIRKFFIWALKLIGQILGIVDKDVKRIPSGGSPVSSAVKIAEHPGTTNVGTIVNMAKRNNDYASMLSGSISHVDGVLDGLNLEDPKDATATVMGLLSSIPENSAEKAINSTNAAGQKVKSVPMSSSNDKVVYMDTTYNTDGTIKSVTTRTVINKTPVGSIEAEDATEIEKTANDLRKIASDIQLRIKGKSQKDLVSLNSQIERITKKIENRLNSDKLNPAQIKEYQTVIQKMIQYASTISNLDQALVHSQISATKDLRKAVTALSKNIK